MVLRNPSFRWTDTTDIPLTPYNDGWYEFNGSSSIVRGAYNPFINLLWNTTDSFRLEFEVALDDTAKLVTYVISCYDPAYAGGWSFNWWFNYGGQFDFFNQGQKQNNVTTSLAVGPGTLGDTLFHRYRIIWTKSDSTMRTYTDNSLTNTYTSVTFGNQFIHPNYGICAGNRIEAVGISTYSDTYTNTIKSNMFKGKIKEFIFSKNDTTLIYNFNSGNQTQLAPVRLISGLVSQPVFPLEYSDRLGYDSTKAGSFYLNNGAVHGIDTMDASYVTTGLKSGYRDCYSEMSTVSEFNITTNVWNEPFGGHLLVLNDTLYYAGNSNTANGYTAFSDNHDSVKGVARWNESTSRWEQLGYGLLTPTGSSGTMFIFAYGDTLIAAGYDNAAVGVGSVNYIAQRKAGQSNWSAMENGFNDAGFSGASAYGFAYAGGFFSQAGGRPCRRIAKWDGLKWDSLRGGLNSVPLKILPYVWNGENGLLVGGSFTEFEQGGEIYNCNGLAYWSEDSLKWKKFYGIETNFEGAIFDIHVDEEEWIYFAGGYSSLGGVSAGSLARFRPGDGIEAIGSGIFMNNQSAAITSMVEHDNIIYIAGSFSRFNGMLSVNFAAFNRNTWEVYDVGYGLDMRVEALAVYNNDIIICGDNYTANGKPRWIIARYHPSLNP